MHYNDVLGQDVAVDICRQFVKNGTAFHQSYLFAGQHGSGKTTTGRILARSMLCANPKDGGPCDACPSCLEILRTGSSECFVEFDAASNSGKADIQRIVEELEYSTLSGKQRIYLFDEAHQLTKKALDGLLKPMEDCHPGSDNKILVCIFCTTEPEKMRDTIHSRCAPEFTIRVVPPEGIAKRLAWVCEQEGVEYDFKALETVAAIKRSHIRDALKTVEAIAQLGPVTMASVRKVLQLDTNESIIRILESLGGDLASAMAEADALVQVMSPATVYAKLAETAILAYKVYLGVSKPPSYWAPGLVEKVGTLHKDFLVVFTQCFASRPGHPNASMLSLDLAKLHQARAGISLHEAPPTNLPPQAATTSQVPLQGTTPNLATKTQGVLGNVQTLGDLNQEPDGGTSSGVRKVAYETSTGVYVDPRGVRKKRDRSAKSPSQNEPEVSTHEFARALTMRVGELRRAGRNGGLSRPPELGGAGTHSDGGSTGR